MVVSKIIKHPEEELFMARTVVYGTNRLEVQDDNLTVAEIKESMSEIFAELKNADSEVIGNEIHFKVKAGTKGMARTVVYGTNRLEVQDDALTVAEIKESMSEIFAELKNADSEVIGNEIHFKVKAGTKGARTVVYGTNRLEVQDDALTVAEIKESMSEIFAELKNADSEVIGNEIHFKVKAGTKGARTVVYGTNRLEVQDDALTVAEIKESMSEIFAELKNADSEVIGNEIHFKVKAGTKGYTVIYSKETGNVTIR